MKTTRLIGMAVMALAISIGGCISGDDGAFLSMKGQASTEAQPG